MNPSAYFLVGPTASGKSSLAHAIAKQYGHHIVSADSMNLYQGLDIGTAKPSTDEQNEATYHGINIIPPTESFSVADYLAAVIPAFQPRATPIVSGGTGLYIKCLTEGFDKQAPSDLALRKELESLSMHQLETRAQTDAPLFYEKLTPDDKKNPRRLIRILERVHAGETRPQPGVWNAAPKPRVVGLGVERPLLCERIEKRIDQMYAEGLLEEAESLIHLNLSPSALQAIGYAEAFDVLNNKCSIDEAKQRTTIRTRQFAKRQMTWFKNQLNVEWVDISKFTDNKQLAQAVMKAWEKTGPIAVKL